MYAHLYPLALGVVGPGLARRSPPKRVLALPDLEHAKDGRAEHPDVGQRPANYDHAISEFLTYPPRPMACWSAIDDPIRGTGAIHPARP